MERSFRTDEEEFYQVLELPDDLGGHEAALQRWNQVYGTVRPHQALGYKTPEQFYQDWLQKQAQGDAFPRSATSPTPAKSRPEPRQGAPIPRGGP